MAGRTPRAEGSLRTVRWALVGAGALLVAVIAGFVGYGRYRAGVYLRGLPGRLGVHITQETDNFTYSQSVKGRTIYTVTAAKQIKREDGRYTLRDVGIVLYGAKGDRADRISGQEFVWDQKAGEMRAVGEVFIDLAAPASRGSAEKKMIHVKTSGLVFREKEKSAATDELVEFRTGEMSGQSVGASYESATGVVVLRSGVRMSGLRGGEGGRPMVLTAGRAEMDRVGEVVKLEGAKVVSGTAGGEASGSAERAVVHLTAQGAPTSVDAEGRVVLTEEGRGGGRGTLESERMELGLNAAGQLKAAHFMGAVRFAAANQVRQERGHGAEARIGFDGEGRARNAVMTGGAEMEERAGKSERRLEAATMKLALGGGGKAPVEVTGARAAGAGGARLRLVDAGKGKGETAATEVRAGALTARFAAGGARGKAELAGLDGVGKTSVEQVATDARGELISRETSTGETLRIEFKAGVGGQSELARAEQRGGVTVEREGVKSGAAAAGKPAGMEVEHARGEVAVYEKDADRLTMTGAVEVQDAESVLFADEVVADRASGETTARGAVRVSYVQEGSAGEPVHVLATRAVSHKATGITDFFAGVGAKAKMWQGGSQVEAPVLEFDQRKKTIVGRDPGGAEGAVRAVLVDSAGKDERGGALAHVAEARPSEKLRAGTGASGSGLPQGPVRVWSREMVYRDAAREVEFNGGVRVEDRDGTMRAQEATVYLAPAPAAGAGEAKKMTPVTLGGRVERMIGTGGVEITQPGRAATGERLVYTAADRTFLLTGTKSAPPKMVDETQGTTTGAALRFKSGEDRVEISGTEAGETRRVRSETKVKQ